MGNRGVMSPGLVKLKVPTSEVLLSDGIREILIPAGITDLDSFRQWTYSDDFPEKVRISYLGGVIWVELGMEQFYTHNQIKADLYAALIPLARSLGQGRFVPDGMQLAIPAAGLTTVPDGYYVSFDSLRTGRVRQVPGRRTGVTELEGAPDMVLEVVSDSSVDKDTEWLAEGYARAGVPEFWRIDARGEQYRFEILRLTDDGFAPTEEPGGWWRSAAFDRSFRLIQGTDPIGLPQYTLEVRE